LSNNNNNFQEGKIELSKRIIKKPEAIISLLLFISLLLLELSQYFFSEILSFEGFMKISLLILIFGMSNIVYHSISMSFSNRTSSDSLMKEINQLKDVFESSLKSVFDDCLSNYSRSDLIKHIIMCTSKLNKFETIDAQIYKLYQEHGLLELADEPRKTNLTIVYKKSGEIEDKVKLKIIQDYRASNEAKIDSTKKKLNRNGLITFFTLELDLKNLDENIISEEIYKHLKTIIKFTSSFPINGTIYDNKELVPKYILPEKEFDYKNIKKKDESDDSISIPTIYGVYKEKEKNNRFELALYINIEIPPNEYVDFNIETEEIVSSFDLWTYEFISWTKGVQLELKFGDEFETNIEYVLTGGTPSEISDSYLKYNGWIMPHSSISFAWKKKNMELIT
jgi:hypothetical protein